MELWGWCETSLGRFGSRSAFQSPSAPFDTKLSSSSSSLPSFHLLPFSYLSTQRANHRLTMLYRLVSLPANKQGGQRSRLDLPSLRSVGLTSLLERVDLVLLNRTGIDVGFGNVGRQGTGVFRHVVGVKVGREREGGRKGEKVRSNGSLLNDAASSRRGSSYCCSFNELAHSRGRDLVGRVSVKLALRQVFVLCRRTTRRDLGCVVSPSSPTITQRYTDSHRLQNTLIPPLLPSKELPRVVRPHLPSLDLPFLNCSPFFPPTNPNP